ncbi:MAG: hypothetical protein L6Q40_06135 [Azonexus sp.]|nr:hypothetical protein [Azonexus sp.]
MKNAQPIIPLDLREKLRSPVNSDVERPLSQSRYFRFGSITASQKIQIITGARYYSHPGKWFNSDGAHEMSRMKKSLEWICLGLAALCLGGCTTQAWYEGARQAGENQCRRQPATAADECLARQNKADYSTYEKARSGAN